MSEDSFWDGVCPYCAKPGPKTGHVQCKQVDARYEDRMQAERQHGDYLPLHDVLMKALEQAHHGKGKERHAAPTGTELPFTEQPICTLARVYGIGYQLGQAAKKAHEAQHLPKERAQAELLGAINYLAAAYLVLGGGVGMMNLPWGMTKEEVVNEANNCLDHVKRWRAGERVDGIPITGIEMLATLALTWSAEESRDEVER